MSVELAVRVGHWPELLLEVPFVYLAAADGPEVPGIGDRSARCSCCVGGIGLGPIDLIGEINYTWIGSTLRGGVPVAVTDKNEFDDKVIVSFQWEF